MNYHHTTLPGLRTLFAARVNHSNRVLTAVYIDDYLFSPGILPKAVQTSELEKILPNLAMYEAKPEPPHYSTYKW